MKRAIRLVIPLLLLIVVWIIAAPPRFWLNLTKRADLSDPAATGEALIAQYDCRSCHLIEGQGRPFGPALDGVTNKLDPQTLESLLRNPKSVNPNSNMPNMHLSDSEITAVIAYLAAND